MIFSRNADSADGQPIERARVLYWIYAGRLAVCLAVFGSALVVADLWAESGRALSAETRLLSLGGLVMAGVFTPLAYWYSHLRESDTGLNFLYGQAVLDILLATGIVHITGGSESVFPPLFYIALAAGYALVVPLRAAIIIALACGAGYLADIALAYPPQLDAPVYLQVVIFTAVASITSVIGGRLRQERVRARRLEGELRRLRLDTTDVLRTIDTPVATFDTRGRLAYMNPAAETLLSLDAAEWLGRDLLRALDDWAPRLASAVRSSLETGESVRNREAMIRRDEESPVPVSASTTVLERNPSRPSVTVVLQDLRPIRRLEELKLRTSRLEAVAELSASLAHEIKNPLASIRSAVEQLVPAADGSDDEDDERLGQLVLRESDRLTQLLGEFSDFARVDVVERDRLDLEELVDETLSVVREHPDTPEDAVISAESEGDLSGVWGDSELIHRTLVNLVLNAVQVSPRGETPVVRIVLDRPPRRGLPPEHDVDSPVRIRVMDDGPGIPADEAEKIFDPFYTRREGGSGLGLSIAHRAVKAHGGTVYVESEPGEGATFTVLLPRREGERSESDVVDVGRTAAAAGGEAP